MSGAHWIVVAALCCEALATILRVGKPRRAYGPGWTAFDVVYWACLALLVVLG